MSTAEINSEPLLIGFGALTFSLLQEINIKKNVIIFIFNLPPIINL